LANIIVSFASQWETMVLLWFALRKCFFWWILIPYCASLAAPRSECLLAIGTHELHSSSL
jgi:hypothetical protein